MEAGLEAVDYYDPPNLTFPFGSYIAVIDIDKGTGEVKVRRFVAVDDCGNIINPMIVDGQIHGGLTMAWRRRCTRRSRTTSRATTSPGRSWTTSLPTAMETPAWETGKTITPSPHHPLGAKGVGESATVGAPPAIANAVVDALSHLGVRNIDIPITPPEGLADPPREGHRLGVSGRTLAAARGAERGGGSAVRDRRRSSRSCGRRPPGPARAGSSIRTAHRGLGRRQLRPARRRARASGRSSTASPGCSACRRRRRRGAPGDGVVELVMTCHSGGTLEIYVEPHLPAPACGSPGPRPSRGARVARGRRRMARVRVRPGGRGRGVPGRGARVAGDRPPAVRPGVHAVCRRRDPGDLGRRGAGRVLRRDASRTWGSSPRRRGRWRPSLAARRGHRDERLAALRAPAGIDLGAETAEEVASRSSPSSSRSGVAGRHSWRRRTGDARRSGAEERRRSIVPVVDDIVLVDPVCGMTVDRAHARHLAEHDGVVYAFCRMGCRTAFMKEPAAYVARPPDRRALTSTPPEARMQFSGTVEIKAPRDKVWAFLIDPNEVGWCGPGVESIEVDRRGPLQGQGEGRRRLHLGAVQGRHDGRRADAARPRSPQGPWPGARVRRGRDGPHGACPAPPRGRRRWTGRRT